MAALTEMFIELLLRVGKKEFLLAGSSKLPAIVILLVDLGEIKIKTKEVCPSRRSYPGS